MQIVISHYRKSAAVFSSERTGAADGIASIPRAGGKPNRGC